MSFNINNTYPHLWMEIVYGPNVDTVAIPSAVVGSVISPTDFGATGSVLAFPPAILGSPSTVAWTAHPDAVSLFTVADARIRVYLSQTYYNYGQAYHNPAWGMDSEGNPITMFHPSLDTSNNIDLDIAGHPVQKIVKFTFDNAVMDSYPSEIRVLHLSPDGTTYASIATAEPPLTAGGDIELFLPLSEDVWNPSTPSTADQFILIGDAYGDGMMSVQNYSIPVNLQILVDGVPYGPGFNYSSASPVSGMYELSPSIVSELTSDAKVSEGKGLVIPISWDNSSFSVSTVDSTDEIAWLTSVDTPKQFVQLRISSANNVPWIDLSDETDMGSGQWKYKVSIVHNPEGEWDLQGIYEALADTEVSSKSLVNMHVHEYLDQLNPGIVAGLISCELIADELFILLDQQVAPDTSGLGFAFDEAFWLYGLSLNGGLHFLDNTLTLENLDNNLNINFAPNGDASRISLDPSSNPLFATLSASDSQRVIADWSYIQYRYYNNIQQHVNGSWQLAAPLQPILSNDADSSLVYALNVGSYPDFSDPSAVQEFAVYDPINFQVVVDVQTEFESQWPVLGNWEFVKMPPPPAWENPFDLNDSDPSKGINISEIEAWSDYNHLHSSSAPAATLTLTITGDQFVDIDPTYLIFGGSKTLASGVTGTDSLEVVNLGDTSPQSWNINVPQEVNETYSIAFIDMYGDGLSGESPVSIKLEDEYGNIIHQEGAGTSWESWGSSYLLNIQWTGSVWQVVAVNEDTFVAANCSNCNASELPPTDGLVFDQPFGGAVKPDDIIYVLPPIDDANVFSWAGFATSGDPGYPISLADGGKIEFTAAVSGPAQVYFRFEKDVHPNVDPSYNTAVVDLVPSGQFDSYSVDIDPQDPANTYSNMVFYVVTEGQVVYMNNVELLLGGNIDNAGAGDRVHLRLISA